MKKEKNPRRSNPLGRLLMHLPSSRLFYPVYLSRQLYLQEYQVTLDRLPRALDGLRIAYASDMHYGAYFDRDRAVDLAERLNALDADLMILGGDYGEGGLESREFWQILPPLRARLGVIAVLGNHDRFKGSAQQLCRLIKQHGATPLVNDTLRFTYHDTSFAVCATDDLYRGSPDYARVARQAAAERFVIYAPHSPDALKAAYALSEKPFFDLALCGHTHGGQVAVLGVGLATSSRLGWRYGHHYRTGLIRERGAAVIVSNGVGSTWLPLRLGVPPQYHLITLKRTESSEQ